MLAILISLNAHNLPKFQPILMILVSKFMVHKAFSDKTYLSLGLLKPASNMRLYDYRRPNNLFYAQFFLADTLCQVNNKGWFSMLRGHHLTYNLM